MLSSHYRKPLNYSEAMLKQAYSALETLYLSLREFDSFADQYNEAYIIRFKHVMNDDFNTPEALAILFELARDINMTKSVNFHSAEMLASTLRYLANSLGLLTLTPEKFFQGDHVNVTVIEEILEKRKIARENKQWDISDQLRQQLASMGILIEDTPNGTLWRKAL